MSHQQRLREPGSVSLVERRLSVPQSSLSVLVVLTLKSQRRSLGDRETVNIS